MTFLLELIPIAALFEILLKTFFPGDSKGKFGYKPTLNKVKSILTGMEPLINGEKSVPSEGKDFIGLIQTLKEGKQLVSEIESLEVVDEIRYTKRLQNWMQTFQTSLIPAMCLAFTGVAANLEQITADVNQIKLFLLLFLINHRPTLKEEEYNTALQKFLGEVNKSEGLEHFLLGIEPKTNAKKLKPKDASAEKHKLITSESNNKADDANVQKRTHTKASAQKDDSKTLESKKSTEKANEGRELESKSTTNCSNQPEFDTDDIISILLYGGGAIAALWLTSAVITAIDSIPLLPKFLEVVGLAYTLWFTIRYLLFKQNRNELADKIEELKEQRFWFGRLSSSVD